MIAARVLWFLVKAGLVLACLVGLVVWLNYVGLTIDAIAVVAWIMKNESKYQ